MHNRSAEHAMMTLPTGKHTIQYVEKNVSNNKKYLCGLKEMFSFRNVPIFHMISTKLPTPFQ